MIKLLEDPELVERMGKNGFNKTLKYYTPESVISRLEDIYHTVLVMNNKSFR